MQDDDVFGWIGDQVAEEMFGGALQEAYIHQRTKLGQGQVHSLGVKGSAGGGLHQLCLRYILLMLLFRPNAATLGEWLGTYQKADAATVNQCALEFGSELVAVAEATGKSTKQIRQAVSNLEKIVPKARKLSAMPVSTAVRLLATALNAPGASQLIAAVTGKRPTRFVA